MTGSCKRPFGRSDGARLPARGHGECDPHEVDTTAKPLTPEEIRRPHRPFAAPDRWDEIDTTPGAYAVDPHRHRRERELLEGAAARPQIEAGGARIYIDDLNLKQRVPGGNWYVCEGDRLVRSTFTRGREAAEAVLSQIRRQRQARLAGISNWQSVTVLEVLEESVQSRDLGAAATERSIAVLRELLADIGRLEPYLDGLTLRDLAPGWAAKALRGLTGRQGYAPTTAHWTLSSLKACVREFAEARGLAIPKLFSLKKPTSSRNEVITAEDWRRLMMALAGCVWDWRDGEWITEAVRDLETGELRHELYREDDPMARRRLAIMHRFIMIGLMTGTRHQAILDLRWLKNAATGWIDLDRGVLYRAGVAAPGSKVKRVEPVIMPGPLLEMARAWREEDRKTGAEAPIHTVRRGKLFGKPYKTLRWSDWRDLLDRAGIEASIKPHSLKKTLTSMLLTSDVPLLATASLLSTRIETLIQHYNATDSLTLQQAAADHVGRAMERTDPIPFEQVTPGVRGEAFQVKARKTKPRKLKRGLAIPLKARPGASGSNARAIH
jgi:integrase